MKLATCSSGLSLLRMGVSFGAWEPKHSSEADYFIDVPASAILETITYEGDDDCIEYRIDGSADIGILEE